MNYTLEVITPPATEPVTVSDLKAQLRLFTDDEDDLLVGYIQAAREQFEQQTYGRIVMPTTFRQHFEGWPLSCNLYWGCYSYYGIRGVRLQSNPNFTYLPLAVANVYHVASITYTDNNGDLQSLDDWESDTTGCPALVYLPSQHYPALSLSKPRPVTVEFTAGWDGSSGASPAIPASAVLAIKLLAAHYFNVREAYGIVNYSETPQGFDRLCSLYNTGLGGI